MQKLPRGSATAVMEKYMPGEDDLKKNLEDDNDGQGGSGSGSGDGSGNGGERPEKRIKKLLGDIERVTEENRTLKFENEFKDLVADAKFSKASGLKEEIQQKVKNGMSTKDAVITTLHDKNLLGSSGDGSGGDKPQNQDQPAVDQGQGFGGSADRPANGGGDGKKNLAKMTQQEKLDELKRLEAAGEITLE